MGDIKGNGEEKPEDGEVEVLEGNGKHYPPKWIPVNRKESDSPDEEKTELNLYYFKKDLSLLLINIILFCSNLDFFREELTLQEIRVTIVVLLSFNFLLQVFLGAMTIVNSPFFSGSLKKSFNSNVLNDSTLATIFLLLIINVSVWVCDVVEKRVY